MKTVVRLCDRAFLAIKNLSLLTTSQDLERLDSLTLELVIKMDLVWNLVSAKHSNYYSGMLKQSEKIHCHLLDTRAYDKKWRAFAGTGSTTCEWGQNETTNLRAHTLSFEHKESSQTTILMTACLNFQISFAKVSQHARGVKHFGKS